MKITDTINVVSLFNVQDQPVAFAAAAVCILGDNVALRLIDEKHQAKMVGEDELVTQYDDGSVLVVYSDIGGQAFQFASLSEYVQAYRTMHDYLVGTNQETCSRSDHPHVTEEP